MLHTLFALRVCRQPFCIITLNVFPSMADKQFCILPPPACCSTITQLVLSDSSAQIIVQVGNRVNIDGATLC